MVQVIRLTSLETTKILNSISWVMIQGDIESMEIYENPTSNSINCGQILHGIDLDTHGSNLQICTLA